MIKKKKRLKEYNGALDTDSLWNRNTSVKRDYDGKTAQEILGLEDEGPGTLNKTQPMSMMDIVLNSWDGDSIRGEQEAYEEEEDSDSESDTDEDIEDDEDIENEEDDELEENIGDGESYTFEPKEEEDED